MYGICISRVNVRALHSLVRGREGGLQVRKKLCVVGGIYAAMNAHSIASTGF